MTVMKVFLAESSLVDPLTIGVAVVALFLLVQYKINSVWLVLGGMAIGVLVYIFTAIDSLGIVGFSLA